MDDVHNTTNTSVHAVLFTIKGTVTQQLCTMNKKRFNLTVGSTVLSNISMYFVLYCSTSKPM